MTCALLPAEPAGTPAAAAGEAGPAAAAAAAPALARDPLEDLLEPTPSAASPEPPKPGEAPTTLSKSAGCCSMPLCPMSLFWLRLFALA